MNKKIIILISIFLIVLAGFFARSIFSKSGSTSVPQSADATTPTGSVAKPGSTTVKGFNYGFSPQIITVKQGENVTVKLVSDDSPHTFTIDELGVNQFFTYGKDASVTFTASKKGTFKFYCAVPDHLENGMVGTLVVE